jgi:alpha-D-ribose 1-methylphosphonate 5-triphosphate synthase subunit PhnH
MLLLLMLLDREVTVAFSSDFPEKHRRLVSELTYARLAAIETAQYIVCTDSPDDIGTSLRSASSGNLIDPHLGATIIAQVSEMTSPANGQNLSITLDGPGIKETAKVSIAGAEQWIDERNAQTADYPLGVDLLVVDTRCRLLALPRTTRAIQGVAIWDT